MGRHRIQVRNGRRRRDTRGRQVAANLSISLGALAALGWAGSVLPGEVPLPHHRTPVIAAPAPLPALDPAPSLVAPKVIWPGQPIRERRVIEVAAVKPLADQVATAADEAKRPSAATAKREEHRPRVATPTKRETAAEHPKPSPRPWPHRPPADHGPKPDPGEGGGSTDPTPGDGDNSGSNGSNGNGSGEQTKRSHPVLDAVRAAVKKHKENSNHGEKK
jgi:hypothetical protein